MTRVVLFAVLIASYACFAADLTTKDGRKYTNYTVYRVSKRGIHITHDEGGATVPFAQLPDDVRRKYAAQERRFAEQSAAQSARRADELALKKIELRGYGVTVDTLAGGDVIGRLNDGTYLIVTDVPDVGNLASGDYLSPNVQESSVIERTNHFFQLKDRTVGGKIVPAEYPGGGRGYGREGGTTYYWAECSRCGKKIAETRSCKDAERTISQLNKQLCSSRKITPPKALVLWDTGEKRRLRWGDVVRVYTYSREKALKIVHPLRKLVISGRFDGAGEFTIHGDRITYRHESWDRPTNVTVNGKPWSDLGSPFDLPGWADVRAFSFRKASGRDKAEFRTDGENGIIRVDDGPNGADDYTMELLSNKDSVPVSK